MPRATLPARAILARFHNSDEQPVWASYIHRQLQGAVGVGGTVQASSLQGPTPASPFSLTPATSQVPMTPHLLRHSSSSGSGTGSHVAISSNASFCSVAAPTSQDSTECIVNAVTMKGHVWESAREPLGSRNVQRVLEGVEPEVYDELALELQGHVLEAMLCPHANYVLHKCITQMAPKALQAITQEFLGQSSEALIQAARHRYGCRIIERLMEVAEPDVVAQLCDVLLHDVVSLCEHAYGNYTIQHLLMHGPVEHRSQVLKILTDNAAEMGANFHGSAVIREALIQGTEEEATKLARALVRSPGLLAQMTRTKHGHKAVKHVLDALDPSEQEAARREFCTEASKPHAIRRKHRSR